MYDISVLTVATTTATKRRPFRLFISCQEANSDLKSNHELWRAQTGPSDFGYYIHLIILKNGVFDSNLHFQLISYSFFKYGPNPASLSLFLFFSHNKYSTNTINEKSLDGVLGT